MIIIIGQSKKQCKNQKFVVQETIYKIELWSLRIDLNFEQSKTKAIIFISKKITR